MKSHKKKAKPEGGLVLADAEKDNCPEELVIAREEKTKLKNELIIAEEEKAKLTAELVIANEEKAECEASLLSANEEKAKYAAELAIANEEKENHAAELVIANADKAKRAAELVIANAEKAKHAAELVLANIEKEHRAAELIKADKENIIQYEEKLKLASELVIADITRTKHEAELVIANIEKTKLIAKIIITEAELSKRNEKDSKHASKLVIADAEKAKRASELVIANIEKARSAAKLVIDNIEKAQCSAELVIAKKELVYQKSEKSKRAAELVIAKVLKAKRSAELVIANIEKTKRAAEFVYVSKELILLHEKEVLIEELNTSNEELRDEIEKRLKSEETLRNSIVFNETLLKTIPFGMDIVDEKGTILFQSDNFKKIFGAQAIGKKCWELYRDDKKQCIDCPLFTGIYIGETDTYESHGVLGDRIFDISHTGMLYQGKKAMLEIFQDITERKLAEDIVQKNENYLKETQLIANLGTYTMEVDSGKWTSSEILDRIFGIDSDYDKSVEGWTALIHPKWQKTMIDYFMIEVIGNKTKFDKEYKIIRKNDKAERWVQGYGNLKFNENGQPITMIGTIQDITERKEFVKKLLRSEHELRQAQQITHIGSWYLDLTTNEVTWTEELYKMYGFDPTLPVPSYTEHMKLFTPESWEILSMSLAKTTETGVPYELELQTIKKDGTNGWMWVRGEAQTDSEGNTVSLWGAAQDISEHKEREKQLEEALEKAKESDRLKSAFLTNMSHEIRTPMNGILGFTELLKEPSLSIEEQKDFIQTIEISGERMLNTINNIVNVSKIESGLAKVDIKETDINDKMKFTYKFFKPETENKGLKFFYKNGLPEKDAIIMTDNEKVYGILTNLIKNAIKFTYEGSVEFGYEKKDAYLEFYVRDTGIGISEKQKEYIFERFIQGSGDLNRVYEGSGLGLSISKSYVEMLGGKIWVESEEGLGSTFYFTIPYNPVSNETNVIEKVVLAENIEVQVKKLKILIVEDDEISYSLLTRVVQKISREVLHAVTGIEAVKACRSNPDIDLVLMDIRMPQMNGLEATEEIRQFNKDVIIIAQTAYGFSSDCEKALEAGCNDYITKPINRNLLIDLITKHIDKLI